MAKTPALQLPHSLSVTSREILHKELIGKLETLQMLLPAFLAVVGERSIWNNLDVLQTLFYDFHKFMCMNLME